MEVVATAGIIVWMAIETVYRDSSYLTIYREIIIVMATMNKGGKMYIDYNQLIKNELYAIERICKAIESSIQREEQKVIGGEQLKGNESLYMSRSSIGIVYYKWVNLQGKRVSKKIGGPDNMEVIKVKQKRYEDEMLDDMPEFKGETIK